MKHDDWTEKELEKGFICRMSTFDDWGYSGNTKDRIYPVTELHYQPRGWWGESISITIEDSVVKLSQSSGGHAKDGTDGLTMIRNYIKCLQDAEDFIVNHKQPKSRPASDFPNDENYLKGIRSQINKLLDWKGEDK
tara:strand:- start:258 stop:665 length:408 start_codon:yes stop_codon:yes gene_type:complete